MPKPPPRFSSSSSSPVASCDLAEQPDAPGARRPRSRRCRRSASRCGCAARPARSAGSRITRTAAVSASPVASEKPNFWSSCAVAMNSWVCASMPTVARTSTGTGAPPAATRAAASGASRSISSKESSDDVPDPGVDGQLQLDERLVVAVQRDPLGREAGGQRQGQLVAAADVQVQAVLGDPAGHLAAEERLRRVVHVGAGERGREVRGPAAEVGLVEHEQRGAVLAGQVGDGAAAQVQLAVDPLAARPDRGPERCGVRGRRSVGRAARRPAARLRSMLAVRGRPGLRVRPHIRSGAVHAEHGRGRCAAPVAVAAHSHSRAVVSGVASSSPRGSTRQES